MQNGTSRRLDVQGLRAVAVLAVVLFHAGFPLRGGFAGVDVFFVISGFIITLVLSREFDDTGKVALGAFYLRRFKRLTPALAVTVTVVVIASMLLQTPFGDQQSTAQTGAAAMLLIANYATSQIGGGYFGIVAETNPLLHTWSLSVEEQFYLVFPALLLLPAVFKLARRDRRRMQIAIVSLIGLLSLILVFATSSSQDEHGITAFLTGFYSPLTRAFEFAAGALLALVGPKVIRPATGSALAGAGLVGLGVALVVIPGSANYPNLWTILVVACTTMLIAAGSAPDNPVSRALGIPLFVLIGDLSYSIYLWHWPMIVFARRLLPEFGPAVPIAAIASMFVGAASYYWIEQPLRRRPIETRRRLIGTVAATSGVCLLASLALLFGARSGWGDVPTQKVQRAQRVRHTGYDCMATITTGGRKRVDTDACTWNAAATGAPIYLLGDSNAAQYSEGLLAYAEAANRPLIVDTTAGCPFADVYTGSVGDVGNRRQRACRDEYTRRFERLQSADPGTVLIAESSRYVLDPELSLGETAQDQTEDMAERTTIFETGLATTSRELIARGHSVGLIEPLVWFAGGGPPVSADRCSTNLSLLRGRCPQPAKLVDFGLDYSLMSDLVSQTAIESGAGFIDVVSQACPDGTCMAWKDGYPVYMNMDHFSADFSAALEPFFERTLSQ